MTCFQTISKLLIADACINIEFWDRVYLNIYANTVFIEWVLI